MLKVTSCVNHLAVFEMIVWGVELLNCYNSDDECGRSNNVNLKTSQVPQPDNITT